MRHSLPARGILLKGETQTGSIPISVSHAFSDGNLSFVVA